jgi:hypothetical protein
MAELRTYNVESLANSDPNEVVSALNAIERVTHYVIQHFEMWLEQYDVTGKLPDEALLKGPILQDINTLLDRGKVQAWPG